MPKWENEEQDGVIIATSMNLMGATLSVHRWKDGYIDGWYVTLNGVYENRELSSESFGNAKKEALTGAYIFVVDFKHAIEVARKEDK